MVAEPGQRFTYNSGASHLLAAVLRKVTGQSLEEYAQEKLFIPLGIQRWTWAKLKDGHHNGAAGLQLRARDLAKLAVLWQQQGRWQQQQLVPASWMLTASEPSWQFTSKVGGLDLQGYGYLWWLARHNNRIIQLGWGYGGQFVLTLPEQDLTLVLLANNVPADVAAQEQRLMQLLVQQVLPALP